MSEGENATLEVTGKAGKPGKTNTREVNAVIIAKAILALEKKPTIKSPELAKALKCSPELARNALQRARRELARSYRDKASLSMPAVFKLPTVQKSANYQHSKISKLEREIDATLDKMAETEDKSSKGYHLLVGSLAKVNAMYRKLTGLDAMEAVAISGMKQAKPDDGESPRNVTPGGW